jgi:hypothetical protein
MMEAPGLASTTWLRNSERVLSKTFVHCSNLSFIVMCASFLCC